MNSLLETGIANIEPLCSKYIEVMHDKKYYPATAMTIVIEHLCTACRNTGSSSSVIGDKSGKSIVNFVQKNRRDLVQDTNDGGLWNRGCVWCCRSDRLCRGQGCRLNFGDQCILERRQGFVDIDQNLV